MSDVEDRSDFFDQNYGQERVLDQGFFSNLWDAGLGINGTYENADTIYTLLRNATYASERGRQADIDMDTAFAVVADAWRQNDPNAQDLTDGYKKLLVSQIGMSEEQATGQSTIAVLDGLRQSVEQQDANVKDVMNRVIASGYSDEYNVSLITEAHIKRGGSLPVADGNTVADVILQQGTAYTPFVPSTPPSTPTETTVSPTTTVPSTTTTTEPPAPSQATVPPTTGTTVPGSATTTTLPSQQGQWTPPTTGGGVISVDEMRRLMILSGQRDIGYQMEYMIEGGLPASTFSSANYPSVIPSWATGGSGETMTFREAADWLFSGEVSPAELQVIQDKLAAAGYLDGERATFEVGDVTDAQTNAAWRSLLGDVYVERTTTGQMKTLDQMIEEKTQLRNSNMLDFADPGLSYRLNAFAQGMVGRLLTGQELNDLTNYLMDLQSKPLGQDITSIDVQQAETQNYLAEELGSEVYMQQMGSALSNYDNVMREIFG